MKLLFLISIFFHILFFFTLITNAAETDKINANDTLIKIAQRNLHRVSSTHGHDLKSYADDLVKWNPIIKNWNPPPLNQYIYVTYPYDVYSTGVTWTPLLGKYREPLDNQKQKKIIFSYATSTGSYSETSSTQLVESKLYIPLAFGLKTLLKLDETHEQYLCTDFFWEKAAKGEFNGRSFSLPGALNARVYYQKYNEGAPLGLFTGIDFEKFSTFNSTAILENGTVSYFKNELYYATIGLIKNFTLMHQDFTSSLSLSQSLLSKSDAPEFLKGTLYNFTLEWQSHDRFSLEVFYKRHELKNTQIFSFDRMGIAFSLALF